MSKLKWEKVERTVNAEGTTITYRAAGTNLIVQSRKRQIPHSNRGGTWEHTSYFVLDDGKEVAEKWRLSEAQKYAEALAAKRGETT